MILLSFQYHLERRFLPGVLFRWKYFVLIDNILTGTISLFHFCVLFSNIYPKIMKWSKIGLAYASDFLKCLTLKIFLTFLCLIWIIDASKKYCENFRKKNEQAEIVENLSTSYLPYKFLPNLNCIKSRQKLQITFFCVKHQAKNDFLQYVESTVVCSNSSLYSK